MSDTLNIICDKCRVYLWFGQISTGPATIYAKAGQPSELACFLGQHHGHPLRVVNDASDPDYDGLDEVHHDE